MGYAFDENAPFPAVSTSSKVTADEEMARRLHEELNGPELSPAAAAVKRSRKAPTFYIPPVRAALPLQLDAMHPFLQF